MSDFSESYKNAVDSIHIPEMELSAVIRNHSARTQKIKRQNFVGKILAVLLVLVVAGMSSASVYAYGAIQRKIFQTSSGMVVAESWDLNKEGSTTHNYSKSGSNNKNPIDEIEESLRFFDSWDEAIEYIPYDIKIPVVNYDVVIAVQMDNYFHVEARYAVSDLSEFTIRYNFFKNNNWEMEYRYNGDILDKGIYQNAFGYSFSEVTVKLENDIYVFDVIAFDDSMVQLEFKNMETDEMHEILDQFNFSE